MIKQTPWIERKFNFDFPVGLFPVIVERLAGALPRIRAIVRDRSESELAHRSDGKWCAKEIIGHLYNLDDLWDRRISDFLQNKEVLTAADMTNRQTYEAEYHRRPLNELLELFAGRRDRLLDRARSLSGEEVVRTALHPRLQTPMRLVDSLFFAAEHDDHELAKMRSLLEAGM